MSAERIKVGQRYTLTYQGPSGLTVTAFILHENDTSDVSTGVTLPLVPNPVPAGFPTVYTASYLFLRAGYYYVSYRTDPSGGEQVVKVYVFRTDPANRAVGSITSTATSREK